MNVVHLGSNVNNWTVTGQAAAAERHMSPDMAQMLEDIERAQEADRVALAERPAAPAAPATLVEKFAAPPAPQHQAHAKAHHKPHHHAHHAMHGAHIVLESLEIAGALGAGMIGGAIGASVVTAGLGAVGIDHVRHGIKDHDKESLTEGTGSLILAARSGLTALTFLGGHLEQGFFAEAVHAAHVAVPVLGIAHGVLDMGMGVNDVAHGIKSHNTHRVVRGGLGVGMGASLMVAAVGGGIPAMITAGAFLAGKIVVHELEDRHHKKHHAG